MESSLPFSVGTIRDLFQARGMFPVDMDRLNSLVSDGVILGAEFQIFGRYSVWSAGFCDVGNCQHMAHLKL